MHSEAATAKKDNVGVYLGISLPAWVLSGLVLGLVLGTLFPKNHLLGAAFISGTWFPKSIVSLAVLLIFVLLAGATTKLVLFHGRRSGRLFGLILAFYLALGLASLVFVTLFIPLLTSLPFTTSGAVPPSFGQWVQQIADSLSSFLMNQPLIQSLLAAALVGYFSALIPALHPVAHGLMKGSDLILGLFRNLLWYYPIMIGCLAIGIPLKFGLKGMSIYGQTILWIAVVTIISSILMIALTKLLTKRTFKQIFSYFAAVWPTGFGTGGSYETLAVNIVSAERDLGLQPEIAEVSVVFGTVLNKSCANMAMVLITIAAARLLHVPISMTDIILLIPPLLILGLVSPGIPGGAGFFMSPIVAVLLHVRDTDTFVTAFIAMYSGLVPMLTTAGNSTNDGLIGAFLNDRFAGYLGLAGDGSEKKRAAATLRVSRDNNGSFARKLLGWIIMLPALWMLVSPQAILGLNQLKWMYKFAFPAEAIFGTLLLSCSLYLVSPASMPAEEPSQSQACSKEENAKLPMGSS